MRFASAFDWLKHQTNEAEDPYKTLGISCFCKDAEVKIAYRKLMMANHPDLGGTPQRTVEINEAYHIIRKKRGI